MKILFTGSLIVCSRVNLMLPGMRARADGNDRELLSLKES